MKWEEEGDSCLCSVPCRGKWEEARSVRLSKWFLFFSARRGRGSKRVLSLFLPSRMRRKGLEPLGTNTKQLLHHKPNRSYEDEDDDEHVNPKVQVSKPEVERLLVIVMNDAPQACSRSSFRTRRREKRWE